MRDRVKIKLVDRLMMEGMLDDLLLIDLVFNYDIIEDDWDTKDALRKVIHYYSTETQYNEFKEERGL